MGLFFCRTVGYLSRMDRSTEASYKGSGLRVEDGS